MSKTTNKTKIKEELKKILSLQENEKEFDSNIIYDGRQYGVRIPAKFAKTAGIDPKKDSFKFKLKIPKTHKEEVKLTGILIKNGRAKKRNK